MRMTYDHSAPKKATNLSVNQDLLRQARDLGLNLSGVLEERLVEIISQARRDAWLAENQDAIQEYNEHIASRGAFSDALRRF